MASQVDIANLALDILGKPTIASFGDNSNAARAITVSYDMLRRALLTGRSTWRFSIMQGSMPADSGAPVSGPYTQQFTQPVDCLRVVLCGDNYPGLNMSDYRLGPIGEDYRIQGRKILSNLSAPLSIQYVADITDVTLMDAWFQVALAADIAYSNCERLTGSDSKQEAARARKRDALSEARASNALLNLPEYVADSAWLAARMQ